MDGNLEDLPPYQQQAHGNWGLALFIKTHNLTVFAAAETLDHVHMLGRVRSWSRAGILSDVSLQLNLQISQVHRVAWLLLDLKDQVNNVVASVLEQLGQLRIVLGENDFGFPGFG
jgi:hypothetical protein